MNFIKTPTPSYQSQDDAAQPGHQRQLGVLGWLASLLNTPTPAYKTEPRDDARYQAEPDE